MSTRSNIGIINRDGSVEMIYCHWDGYPSHNGRILLESYKTEDKIRELMALGDLSSLGPELGTKHDFNYVLHFDPQTPEYKKLQVQCTAFGRDRNETGVDSNLYKNVDKVVEVFSKGWCEFIYLFDTRTHTWIYGSSRINDHQFGRFYILTPRRCRRDQ